MNAWIERAKRLPEGASTRIDCEFCNTSTSNTVIISHKQDGVSFHCFVCKENIFVPHGLRSISKLHLKTCLEAQEVFRTTEMKLPKDFTLDIPEHLAIWLYKSSVFKETAKLYGIGFSPSMQRIILPVYNNDELVYMQARSVLKEMQPKYLNRTAANKTNILFESLPSEYIISDCTVVTEAVLSAVRVGWYAKTHSTLGSNLTDAQAYRLSSGKVLLWYDPDKAGEAGSHAAYLKLRKIGCNVTQIRTKKKPKEYTNAEIRSIIIKHE